MRARVLRLSDKHGEHALGLQLLTSFGIPEAFTKVELRHISRGKDNSPV